MEKIRLTTFAAESGLGARPGRCDLRAVPDALPRSSLEFGRMRETRDDATYWFRHLAEANALRDVNAMGARPLTAVTTIRSVEASLVGPLMVEALA